MVKWLRENTVAAGILALLRLYLGFEWMIAGFEKISGGKFDASGFLKGAIANPVKGPDGSIVYGNYVGFLKSFALPNSGIFNVLVPWGEFFVGLGLILGALTTAAMFFGLVMNFSYLMAGTVSSNPWDILIGIFIVFAGYNAGKFGLDRWVIPYIRKNVFKKEQSISQNV